MDPGSTTKNARTVTTVASLHVAEGAQRPPPAGVETRRRAGGDELPFGCSVRDVPRVDEGERGVDGRLLGAERGDEGHAIELRRATRGGKQSREVEQRRGHVDELHLTPEPLAVRDAASAHDE